MEDQFSLHCTHTRLTGYVNNFKPNVTNLYKFTYMDNIYMYFIIYNNEDNSKFLYTYKAEINAMPNSIRLLIIIFHLAFYYGKPESI